MKSKVITLFLIFIILLSSILLISSKPSIHDVSIEDLQNIKGIGSVLSDRVGSFLLTNPDCDIEDLLEVEGIGEERLELIRKEFK